jgi:hypothetical protein
MSNPNLKTRYALQRCTPFCVTIENSRRRKQKGGVLRRGRIKGIKTWLAKGFTRRRQQCHPLRSRPRLR